MHIRDAVNDVLGLMRQERWDNALTVLHEVLNVRIDDPVILMLMGTCHRMKGNDGMAYQLLLKSIELKPDHIQAMINIAGLLREMGKHDEEKTIWDECQRLHPDNPQVLHNIAGMYINNATPELAEEAARYAIKMNGESPDTTIQLGLALLEQEKFAAGFDALDRALMIGERKLRNFWALGQTPMWDGTPGKNLVVYGEQGHGDEIMFASCLNEAISISKQVFIDTSKADMVAMYERSFPEAVVLCTPDSQFGPKHAELEIDAMIPFGSLPTLFRRSKKDFPRHDGYIKAHPAKRREMRRRLDALGDRPKIGVAWRGGIKKTHSVYRNIPLAMMAPILRQDADFISVHYGPDAKAEADLQQDITGVPVHHWQAVVDDFDMLTALIAELDLLITVPQTAAHQRAAQGLETWVLVASKPPWTFGLKGRHSVWYPKQTRLFRQRENEGWEPAIKDVARALAEKVTGTKDLDLSIPPAMPNERIELMAAQ